MASAEAIASSAACRRGGGLARVEQDGGPAARGHRRGQVQAEARGLLLGALHVGLSDLRPAPGQLGVRQHLPVEAALHRDRVLELVPADLPQHVEPAVEVPEQEEHRRERPPRAPAPRRHRAAGHASAHAGALLARLDAGVEVARVVEGERELEERPEQVVGVAGEACRLHGRLAELERLGHPSLRLERVALHEHQRDQQPALAGGPRDLDAAVGVLDRRVVVLEVVVGPAEVVERLEVRRQLGVGQPVDLLEGLGAVLARGLDSPVAHLAERESGGRRRDQRPVAELARGLEGGASHLAGLVEVERVEPVHRQLDLQRRGLGGVAVGKLLPARAGAAGGPPRGVPASARRRRTGW